MASQNATLKTLTTEIQSACASWINEFGFAPRREHEPWARHVFRELNKECDALASAGRSLQKNAQVIEIEMFDEKPIFLVPVMEATTPEKITLELVGPCVVPPTSPAPLLHQNGSELCVDMPVVREKAVQWLKCAPSIAR